MAGNLTYFVSYTERCLLKSAHWSILVNQQVKSPKVFESIECRYLGIILASDVDRRRCVGAVEVRDDSSDDNAWLGN